MNEKLQKLINKASALFEEKKWGAVITKCDEIVPLLQGCPATLKVAMYNARGIAKRNMGDHKGAIADHSQAIEIDPKNSEAYSSRGTAKCNMGNYADAITDHNQAIEINPQDADAYDNRGTTKDSMGDHKGAIADFDHAIKINPQNASAYNNRGNAKNSMGDHKGAIADFDHAIEINPQNAKIYSNRGNAKGNTGDHKGAIADYDHAIEIDPQNTEMYYNRGNAKNSMGDYKGAIADYDHAIKIDPQNAEAYNNRGTTKGSMSDHRGAIADFDHALKIAPENTSAIHNRAVALAMQESQKGREEIEAKYQAQLRAQQEQFDRNLQEHLRAQQEQFDRELQAKVSETKDISKELEYAEKRDKYDEKLIRQKQLIEDAMAELRHWSARVYGVVAAFGVLTAVADLSPFFLIPFVIMGTLSLFPLGWRIRMLNRDKHKYWALREDADAKIKMARIILINPALQKELIVKLFDHHDKRGSAHLIADWSRADTSGGNNIVSVDSMVKPGDKGGDS